jgi:hypothetical protein
MDYLDPISYQTPFKEFSNLESKGVSSHLFILEIQPEDAGTDPIGLKEHLT